MVLNQQSVVALVVAFVGFYVIVAAIISIPSFVERTRRWKNRYRPDSKFFSRATIAYDLIPKLTPYLSKHPTFYITAADAHPLKTAKLYPWQKFIRDALERNSTVHYILTDVSEHDEQQLLSAKQRLEAGTRGKLYMHFVARERVADDDRELVDSMRTFHILLGETDTERLMWTENYHPPRSTVAYGCQYVAPADAANNPRYDEYKQAIIHLIEAYPSPKAA